jgi:hypothetical protein
LKDEAVLEGGVTESDREDKCLAEVTDDECAVTEDDVEEEAALKE